MDYTKYKQILHDFSKGDIESFLGENLYNAIMDWETNEEMYTKSSLINIISSVYGFSLFKDKSFRKLFFQKIPENDLHNLLPGNDNLSYEKIANKAAKISFSDNDLYRELIHDYLGCSDYRFNESYQEEKQEIVSRSTERFFELFDYQYLIKQQVLFEIERNNPIGRKILVHMPTGTGKTKTTMHVISYYLNFLNKHSGIVVWIADRNELLIQAVETFRNVWGHLGLYDATIEKSWGNGEYTINDGILFISIQALMDMKKANVESYNAIKNKTRLVVFDECHKIGAEKTKEVVLDISKSEPNKKRDLIGLTATPGRTTEQSFENLQFRELFDRIINIDIDTIDKINMSEMDALNANTSQDIIHYFQDREILSKLNKEELEYIVDEDIIERIKKESNNRREEFSKELIEKIANNRARNSEILNRLIKLNTDGIPTIVFACSVDHARLISAFLTLEGIPNSLVYGEMEDAMRKKAISDFKDRNNPVNIIINYDILTTGFDSTNIECVFITRPTKSVILYSQMIGRGLRGPKMGGNKTCLLIDVKDNLDSYNENEAFSHFKSYWR